MAKCQHCRGQHHKDIQCHLLINHIANVAYLKKNPKTKDAILKTNTQPHKCQFNKFNQNNNNNQFRKRKGNEIEEIDDTKNDESSDEDTSPDQPDNEDICHIEDTQYDNVSINDDIVDEMRNLTMNIKESYRIGVEIENQAPTTDVCAIT
eukprot:12924851-Ditylum_brightwellii.AAC.1